MSNRYQVMFVWKDETRFGIVDAYSDEAKKYAKQGKLLISDAVRPQRFVVPDDGNVVDIKMEIGHWNPQSGDFEGGDEYQQYVRAEAKKARALSDSLPPGVQVGKMFSIGVGDGQADYVVTKVMRSKCQVEWRGFSMDRWTDHHFGWGGSFPIKDIARYVGQAEAMAKLFGKK